MTATYPKPTRRGPKPNGALKLPLGWRGGFYTLAFTAGPYDGFADFAKGQKDPFGVCVREELIDKLQINAHLPIVDFQVPRADQRAQVETVMKAALVASLAGRNVYVGCMGGWGRTGLFLGLLAKAAGVEDPVAYVRKHYAAKAIETQRQEIFIRDFDVTEITRWLRRTAWKHRFGL